MKIILIPCSGSKVSGGQSNSQSSKLADFLSPASHQKLVSARQELAAILQKGQSPGSGFKDDDTGNKYLPAFQRYQGLIYAHSDISRLYPEFKGRLVIISAMYGLLDGNDLIRNYELSMDDALPTRIRVSTFWRWHELREILIEFIRRDDVTEVHDLLSEKYREAIRPWPDTKINNCRVYNYPGLGQGSSYARAKDLKQLLSC